MFVEIGWELYEILDFGFLLGSDCTKMFLRIKTNFFDGTSKNFTDPQLVHQDRQFELWTTSVRPFHLILIIIINHNPNANPPKPYYIMFFLGAP